MSKTGLSQGNISSDPLVSPNRPSVQQEFSKETFVPSHAEVNANISQNFLKDDIITKLEQKLEFLKCL